MLDLALCFTPAGTTLTLTLATVNDRELLLQALRQAVAEAESDADQATDPLAAGGFRTKARYLRKFLKAEATDSACRATAN